MPWPTAPNASKWMQCTSCGEGRGPLRSLLSLEEQLELSFKQLRHTLAEVRDEIASLQTTQTEPPPPESPVIESVRLGPEPIDLQNISDISASMRPVLAPPEKSTALEVPLVLRNQSRDYQDLASRSAWIAAERTKAMAQGSNLVDVIASEGHGMRLHPRWMEMAAKSNLNPGKYGVRRSMRHGERSLSVAGTKSLRHVEEEDPDDMMQQLQPKCFLLLPHSPVRVCWDILGLCLIIMDAFMVPISLAWDVGIEPIDIGSTLMCISFLMAFSYWSSDVFMTLNTGFYSQGRLVLDRGLIFCNYFKTWLLFDLLLVSLDVASAVYQFTLSSAAMSGSGLDILKSLRALRVLRGFRLLRLLKMSRLRAVIEEASVAAGRQWLVLVVAIVNTTLTMVLCAHVLACGWYLLGRDNGDRISWLELSNVTELSGPVQYIHAMQWVLMPPSPPPVAADNAEERLYCIFIVGSTVVIIGSALSKITGTLAELRTINSEGSKRRREVRQYLHAQHVSMELTSRIMRFVDYKLGRQSSVALDPSLLSPSLVIELQVSQRGAQLTPHPLFGLIREAFPEVFASICGAVEKHVFGKMETVFAAESWAHHMWLTTTGRFLHLEATETGEVLSGSWPEGEDEPWDIILAGEWFAEAALFAEAVTYESTLRAETFGEAFSLKGADFARTLMNSPSCTSLVCDYGKDLLAKYGKSQEPSNAPNNGWTFKAAEDLSFKCLKTNSVYQEVHPDPHTVLDDIDLTKDYSEWEVPSEYASKDESMFSNVKNQVARRMRRGSDRLKESIPAFARGISESAEEVKVEEGKQEEKAKQSSDASEAQKMRRISSSVINGESLGRLARQLVSKQVSMAEASLALGECMPELCPQRGVYALFEQHGEREKSESCCVSLMALLMGSCEDYTRPQGKEVRLQEAQWQELQQLVAWTQPSESTVRAALVLLAIRALGKCKRIVQQLPHQAHRPEQALIHLIRNYTNVVPSVTSISDDEVELIADAMEVHKDFNLAQMLQGENVPASVQQLKELVQQLGIKIFRFYILFLLGFMSGLAGGSGSRFMNARNAASVIVGIRTLLHILDSSPQAIYWGFLELRARQLTLPRGTPEDFALVRLGCLARVQDLSGFQSLKSSWMLLGLRERQLLVRHFLSDGIEEFAFVCEFLPDCVGKARANRNVGLHLLLEVLVHLIEHLQQAAQKLTQGQSEVKMIHVDLSDFAEFISIVHNRFIFSTCISRSRISVEDSRRWYLQMTSANWSRTHEKDTDTTTLAYGVKEMLQRQKFLQEVISSPAASPGDGQKQS